MLRILSVKFDIDKERKKMENNKKIRYYWVDRTKLIACILVLMGHFISGLILANILENNFFWDWFEKTIYYFHVPLFFICSGFLYQQRSKVNNLKSWRKNVIKKFILLGVPYFTFSIVTILIKMVVSNEVNNEAPELLRTIFLNPIAPFWYLYVLFFVFLVTKTFNKKIECKSYLIISFLLKILSCIISNSSNYDKIPYFLRGIMGNEIWFVLGMTIPYIEKKYIKNKFIKEYILLFVLAILFSVLIIKLNINVKIIEFIMGLIFCTSIIGILNCNNKKENKVEKFFSRYTMEIFLMHTIFAAGIRIILIKMEITNAIIHIMLGFIFSLFVPILIAKIIEKSKIMKFFIYPNVFLGERLNEK